jgi:hypothetical protein
MKLKIQAAGAAIVAASLIASFAYAADKAPAKKKAKTETPSSSAQIQSLREELQKQINSLKSDLSAKDSELKQAQESAAKAEAAAAKAEAAASAQNQAVSDNSAAVNSLQSTVEDMKGANASLAAQLSDTTSKSLDKSKLSEIALGKVKIGATVFADYTYWSDYNSTYTLSNTFMDNMTTPTAGIGVNNYNNFEITRAYINLLYTPSDAVSVRITPDIYRNMDATAVTSKISTCTTPSDPTTCTVTNTYSYDQSIGYRLKYAYIDFNTLFAKVKYINHTKVTFGQTQNSFTDWEEGLTGHRYTYKMPMDFSSGLSSTYLGAKARIPVEVNGKTYLDIDTGVYTNGAYNKIEYTDSKQFMGRATAYPFGTKKERTGLGLTIFGDYAFNNANSLNSQYEIDRMAFMGHYQTEDKAYLITGQYNLIHNNAANGTNSVGYAFEGNARLGGKKSPFQAFGMFQEYEPKTNTTSNNSTKYMRTVGGVAYKFNKNLDIALTDSNIHVDTTYIPTGDTNAASIFMQYNF